MYYHILLPVLGHMLSASVTQCYKHFSMGFGSRYAHIVRKHSSEINLPPCRVFCSEWFTPPNVPCNAVLDRTRSNLRLLEHLPSCQSIFSVSRQPSCRTPRTIQGNSNILQSSLRSLSLYFNRHQELGYLQQEDLSADLDPRLR